MSEILSKDTMFTGQKCTQCGETKSTDEFSKIHGKPHSWCKLCRKVRVTAVAALDGGVNGGLAVLNQNGEIETAPMPGTDEEICDLLLNVRLAGIKQLAVEELVTFTGRKLPGSTMAVYAANYGFLKGAAFAFGFKVSLVRPQQWQHALGLERPDISQPKWKAFLAATAKEKFPGASITLKTADAALLALAFKNGIPGTFRCSVCCKVKAVSAKVKGEGSWCKECSRDKTAARKYWLMGNYGITLAEFESMRIQQGSKCAICKETPDKTLSVDHNHETGDVRGLLCSRCNWGLGSFGDSPERLAAAIDYLRLHQPDNV